MRKYLWVLILLVTISLAIYWFAVQKSGNNDTSNVGGLTQEVSMPTYYPAADVNCSANLSNGIVVRIMAVTQNGFNVQTAAWEGDYPVRDFTVLTDGYTLFCDGRKEEYVAQIRNSEPGEIFWLVRAAEAVPRETDGFPKAGITITATEIRGL